MRRLLILMLTAALVSAACASPAAPAVLAGSTADRAVASGSVVAGTRPTEVEAAAAPAFHGSVRELSK
ncbi:MAG: hypothetical protein M3387_05275, partial [Actinomycetota bacterium]|nr:hypothetical protein [Actinomycetota bacterium]